MSESWRALAYTRIMYEPKEASRILEKMCAAPFGVGYEPLGGRFQEPASLCGMHTHTSLRANQLTLANEPNRRQLRTISLGRPTSKR